MNIAIIGTGKVGGALATKWQRPGITYTWGLETFPVSKGSICFKTNNNLNGHPGSSIWL